MQDFDFTDQELAQFLRRFDGESEWGRWERASGLSGRDLISVFPKADEASPIRIAKDEEGYIAAGFRDLGLVVQSTFEDLLDLLAPASHRVA